VSRSALVFQRVPNTICDHGRLVVDGEDYDPLESERSRDEQTEAAPKRVSSNSSLRKMW
jgi:hypothetical protein